MKLGVMRNKLQIKSDENLNFERDDPLVLVFEIRSILLEQDIDSIVIPPFFCFL